MERAYDLVIRNGLVIDGSGGEPFEADVAVKGSKIAAVGSIAERGAEEIDARGKIVTPGFVDIHTHYDGQVTWEHTLAPSSAHGVTTVVMGNCGVGFAPIREEQRMTAVALMEGVEDIPGVVMAEGLPWNWETFPQYLDAIEAREADVDFAAQLPHSPLRVYVMGDRGLAMEPPTDEDLAQMRRLTTEAIRAGAIGVSTSRFYAHRFVDGRLAPSLNGEEAELMTLAEGLRDAGTGVFQISPNQFGDAKEEIRIIERLQEVSGRPVSFSFVKSGGDGWRHYTEGVQRAASNGVPLRAQFIPRPMGTLFGLDLSMHPFACNPSYQAIANLPLAEKVKAMRDPDLRRRLLAEEPEHENPNYVLIAKHTKNLFRMSDPPNYSPEPEENIAVRAAAQGVSLLELLYDELLEDEGRTVIYAPIGNLESGRPEPDTSLAGTPNTLLGLGDGGAHYGMICDSSLPTYFLTECVRDAPERGISLPVAIRMLSHDCAQAMGFGDRGLIKQGYKADINVIDLDRLQLRVPTVKHDLPAEGRRVTQKADGYAATVVSGQVTYRNGEASGNLPGRLVRGAREAPQA